MRLLLLFRALDKGATWKDVATPNASPTSARFLVAPKVEKQKPALSTRPALTKLR